MVFLNWLTKIAGALFVLLLLAGVPALSYATARRPELRTVPRRDLYFSAVISQWLLTAVGVVVALAGGPGLQATGFRAVPLRDFYFWVALLAAVSLAGLGLVLVLERRNWWPPESDLVLLLIPASRREQFLAVLMVAPTAALCEEFLYRGYLLTQISAWLGGHVWGWAVSSIAFGLAHAYQGLNGMARAAILGALLAYPVVHLGSLYPSMAAHFLIDAIALAWLGPRFLPRPSAL
ncbi:MAG: CPBP family intramembrane metalloprotease [Acidobacteriia bacterium]|nr:CPBP family intramembrane metalloprotease [Terriglobia bacterium]